MYIFVSLLYSEAKRKQVIKEVKAPLESAANTYQWGLLHGLKESTQEEIKILNSVPMGTFPMQSKILREQDSVEKDNGYEIDNIGYWNIPVIKQAQRFKGLYKRLRKILESTNESITIILYSLYYPYLKALDKLKKKYPNFQYIIIVPDLPCEYGIESSKKLKRWISRKMGYKALDFAQHADGYILLTEAMNSIVNKKNQPYEIVEGIGSIIDRGTNTSKYEKPVILYTGNLDGVFGIESLLKAYLELPKGLAELWIAGGGDMQSQIQALSSQDTGIKFLGYCTKEEVLEMQANARILANPRSGKEEYAKYSFPSKTMEYLASGKPVAMNRLPGLPREYEEYLFFFKDESSQGMAETLQQIFALSLEDLKEREQRQLDFIRNKKCGAAQARKIIKLKESYFNQG